MLIKYVPFSLCTNFLQNGELVKIVKFFTKFAVEVAITPKNFSYFTRYCSCEAIVKISREYVL